MNFLFLTILTITIQCVFLRSNIDVLHQLYNIKSIDELENQTKVKVRQQIPTNSRMAIFSENNSDKVKPVVGGCTPRQLCESVPLEGDKMDRVFWPVCIEIHRCGGCCIAGFKCVPSVEQEINFSPIIILKSDDHNSLKYDGEMDIMMKNHTACSCKCPISLKDCYPNQIFVKNSCRCECPRQVECNPKLKKLNPNTCRCECFSMKVCKDNERWNNFKCRCELYSNYVRG
ncbi:hypothetical protein SNEBB_011265, partial [Seison nebaliae]